MLVTVMQGVSADFAKVTDTARGEMRNCEVHRRRRGRRTRRLRVCRSGSLAVWNPQYYVAWIQGPASNPQFGTAWEIPGGGIEPGESYAQAALREETGSKVAAESIEAPRWLGARWWSLSQIAASNERFCPLSLATMLPRCLSGEGIEQELERWPFRASPPQRRRGTAPSIFPACSPGRARFPAVPT
jgi:NUDIX domain-containing protein